MLTPSEYKTKLLDEIEEHWNILTQYLNVDSIRMQAQINTINCYLNQWKEFKTKSIVSQIDELDKKMLDDGYVRLDPVSNFGKIIICSKCGRKAIGSKQNHVCNMTQPNGSKCNGIFQ